jgi:large conductance mechanosensitive channel
VVIGAAFGAVVASFTSNLIQPLIKEAMGGGVTGGKVKLSTGNYLDFGAVINALITFAITAAVVYFVFVLPINAMNDRRKAKRGESEELTNEERMVQLLEEIAAK